MSSHRIVVLLVLLSAAAAITLPNLGNQLLWQDEAQTALISETVLAHGIPYGYDGKNYLSQELGAEYGRNYVWKWHTWLPFYVTAASFGALGHSTFAARLPFAIFGILTIVLIFCFAKELFSDRRIAWLSSLLLGLNVPFLILSRQCRWYSMAAFFCLLGLYAYARFLRGRRYSAALLVAALVLIFHTHYIYAFTLGLAIILHAAILERKRVIQVVLLCGVSIGINLPWIVWLSGMKYADQYGAQIMQVGSAVSFAGSYALKLWLHAGFTIAAVLLAIFLIARWFGKGRIVSPDRETVRGLWLIGIFIALAVGTLAIFSPAPFYRYLTPVIPAALVLVALVASLAFRIHRFVGIAGTLVVIFSGPVPSYIYEITHDYKGPMDGIVRYLNVHGTPHDTVAITYEDMPVKFYTRMRVVGGLTGEDLSPARNARWIIVRKYIICDKDARVREYLVKNVDFSKYQPVVIDYPDIAYENREEPGEHLFRTSNSKDRIIICKRIE